MHKGMRRDYVEPRYMRYLGTWIEAKKGKHCKAESESGG